MRLASHLIVLAAMLPALAHAAAPGCNLSWTNCSITSATQNFAFACDDNGLTRKLIASYRLASATPDFVAVSMTLHFDIWDPGTPAWFQFGPGGCREGAFAPVSIDSISGCTNAYSGGAQAGGFVVEQTRANRWRIHADWAREAGAAQTAHTLYTALVMQLNTTKSFDDGFGRCEGCEVRACFWLPSLQVLSLSQGMVADLGSADLRDWVSYQGTPPCGCPCTPTQNSTWGAVKALYR